MAKTMARIADGVVVNIESWNYYTSETDVLKEIGDYPVDIGDSYDSGNFYRDKIRILSKNEDMSNALNILLGDE